MNYKTPGVYVEEISLFPPSVAEVATAIPAFIGYTEKAKFKGKELAGKAVEVSSLVEFEERFGKGPAIVVDKVVLTESNAVSEVETSTTYLLYDSLRLYFSNGGGRCYIVSVGQYGKNPKDEIKKEDIEKGLGVIAREDEPTMLLFPDATCLDGTKLYELQQAALKQAADLGDRFVIMDLLEKEAATAKEEYKEFRNNIGINNLPYGAAYTPYLEAGLPKEVKYRNTRNSLYKYGGQVKLASLTEEQGVKDTIKSLEDLIADDSRLQTVINTIKGSSASLQEAYQAKVNDFKDVVADGAASDADVRAAFKELCTLCYNILGQVFDDLASGTGPLKGEGLKSLHYFLNSKFAAEFSDIAEKLNSYLKDAGHADLNEMYTTFTWDAADWSTVTDSTSTPPKTFDWTASDWTDLFDNANVTADDTIYGADPSTKARLSAAEPFVSTLFKRLSGAVGDLQLTADSLEKEKEALLLQQMPTYKTIVKAINDDLIVVPPSGAIAGIYCYVDKTRGVWKAPANVSLSNVARLTERIDDEEQADLNVDVNAGKSINAIRFFSGKGNIVWGARTLAGNDNEWRYIPVRRFFNMVEESVKKSTNWAVFEPNDASLWTKIKAMIENYLTLKWREGALTGAKPDEAFFVNVGLGTTMTQQDILEGRLIVDIGMAVVRPAEFIILRFMHKMQES
ncbi:MAG: phage tail sheath subtilisin-like domain-containing protein [Desulfobulbaceae bacterium]|nr:phage tail sheath subtilisin-like domain-containing protein [Desulfobulbaceae bacterium]